MADAMTLWDCIDRFGDKSEDVRLEAREEIVRRGQDAVPTLVLAIDNELIPWEARSFACGTLAAIKPLFAGEKPDALMQALEDSLYSDSFDAVALALVNFGTAATAPLLAMLSRGDKKMSRPLAIALAQIAKVDSTVMPAVIRAIDDENWNVRAGAAQVLFDTEPPPPVEAIAPLIRSLNEEDQDRRDHIVDTLSAFGALGIPALLESLRSPDWRVRASSAKALAWIEMYRKLHADREPYIEMGVVPALIEALGDEEVEVMQAAASALSAIGPPESNSAIPVLMNILRERKPPRFRAAERCMGWVRHAEPGFETELIDALADPDAGIRASAASLLGRIEAPASSAAVPALLGALHDDAEEVRFEAAQALAVIAPEVSAAGVPILHSVLLHGGGWAYMKDPVRPWERRKDAIRALERHGSAAAVSVPALIDALDEYCLADRAADALGSIGPLASAAVPALLRALRGPDQEIRDSAARALAAIGPEAASAAVPILLDRLREPDEYNRCSAANCLAEIGLPAAKVAIPALQEFMDHESKWTRRHVACALRQLGCDVPEVD